MYKKKNIYVIERFNLYTNYKLSNCKINTNPLFIYTMFSEKIYNHMVEKTFKPNFLDF